VKTSTGDTKEKGEEKKGDYYIKLESIKKNK
jgi:hypothetical protein